jgi:hypothetical protein
MSAGHQYSCKLAVYGIDGSWYGFNGVDLLTAGGVWTRAEPYIG